LVLLRYTSKVCFGVALMRPLISIEPGSSKRDRLLTLLRSAAMPRSSLRQHHRRAARTSAVPARKMATVIRPTVTTPGGVMRPRPLRLMFFPMCTSNPYHLFGVRDRNSGRRVAHLAFSIAFDGNVGTKG
jgi:hypothetical protein